jgi:spermidine synthase
MRPSRTPAPILPAPLAALVYAAALTSGAAALVHEVAWSRLFVLVVGSSADSAMVILAGFMAGFGGGALLAGKLERTSLPLPLFAASQLLVGLYGAFLVPVAPRILPPVLLPLLQDTSPSSALLARTILALILVALPAALMGMASPLLLRSLAVRGGAAWLRDERLARRAGAALIALTTAGACAGTLLSGYVLIPAAGMLLTCRAASTANMAAAALAALAALVWQRTAPPGPAKQAETAASTRDRGRRVMPLLGAFIAGWFVLGMEIVWRRLLVLVFGHDTYGMTAMLFVVIAGMAAGGGLGYGLLRLVPGRALQTGGVLLALTGLLTPPCLAAAAWLVLRSPADPFGLVGIPSQSTALYGGIANQLLVAATAVGLPSILAGAVLPVLCGELERSAGGARPLAMLLVANDVGSVGGALASASVVGLLGIHGGTLALGALAACGGAVLLVSTGTPARRMAAAALLAACAGLFILLPGDLPRRLFLRTAGGSHLELLYYEEGRTSTVGVTLDGIDRERQLLVNGVNEVSSRFVHDQSFALLGHLGMLLHPDPRDVLLVSYGGGITAGAAATHRPRTLTAVDLEKLVLPASAYLSDLNEKVFAGGKLDVVFEDGRFFLETAARGYDVIIIDSTHPRSIDSWMLYTRQFYGIVRANLEKRGGIVVQWVPLHGMSVDEFKIILATFLETFPEGQLWANVGYDARGFSGYGLLVGTPDENFRIDYERVQDRIQKNPAVRASLGRWRLIPDEDLLACFVGAGKILRRWTKGKPVIDDDQPIIPFVTPWSKGPRIHPSVLTQVLQTGNLPFKEGKLMSRFESWGPPRLLGLGQLFRGNLDGAKESWSASSFDRYSQELDAAVDYYTKLAAAGSSDRASLLLAIRSLRGLGAYTEAFDASGRAAMLYPKDPAVLFEHALSLEHVGRDDEAMPVYAKVLALEPGAVPALNNLALLLAKKEQYKESLTLLQRSRELDPGHPPTWVATGKVQMMRREYAAAVDALRTAVSLQPDAQSCDLAGQCLIAMGKPSEALSWLKKASALDPYWQDPYVSEGIAHSMLKDFQAAQHAFEKAVLIDPHDDEPWRLLGTALTAQALWKEAIEPLLMSLQINAESDAAWLQLGLAYRETGSAEQAEECFASALRINPDLAGKILNQGGKGGAGGKP